MQQLSELEINLLRVGNGEVVKLPYNNAQAIAQSWLVRDGMMEAVMEDDQPTAYTTERGKAFLLGQR